MALVNIDSATIAALLAQLANESAQSVEADYPVLLRRFPSLPWRDILSAIGGGSALFAGGLAPSTDGARAALVNQVADVGGVSNPAIFDTTGAVNTAVDTGTLDVSAWRELAINFGSSGGVPSYGVYLVDDAGGLQLLGPAFANPGNNVWVTVGPGAAVGNLNNGIAYPIALPRRIRAVAAAIVGQFSRIFIVGRR